MGAFGACRQVQCGPRRIGMQTVDRAPRCCASSVVHVRRSQARAGFGSGHRWPVAPCRCVCSPPFVISSRHPTSRHTVASPVGVCTQPGKGQGRSASDTPTTDQASSSATATVSSQISPPPYAKHTSTDVVLGSSNRTRVGATTARSPTARRGTARRARPSMLPTTGAGVSTLTIGGIVVGGGTMTVTSDARSPCRDRGDRRRLPRSRRRRDRGRRHRRVRRRRRRCSTARHASSVGAGRLPGRAARRSAADRVVGIEVSVHR